MAATEQNRTTQPNPWPEEGNIWCLSYILKSIWILKSSSTFWHLLLTWLLGCFVLVHWNPMVPSMTWLVVVSQDVSPKTKCSRFYLVLFFAAHRMSVCPAGWLAKLLSLGLNAPANICYQSTFLLIFYDSCVKRMLNSSRTPIPMGVYLTRWHYHFTRMSRCICVSAGDRKESISCCQGAEHTCDIGGTTKIDS